MLLEYAQEVEVEATHHRFMPWWAIVWMPLIVTMSTMAFSPNSFHYMILYVMYENAMSILKLGAVSFAAHHLPHTHRRRPRSKHRVLCLLATRAWFSASLAA